MKFKLLLVVMTGLMITDVVMTGLVMSHGHKIEEKQCVRELHKHVFPPINLKCFRGKDPCKKELHDIAVIQKFKLIAGTCGAGDYGVLHDGRQAENATVWVRDCFGLFEVGYLPAYCEECEINSQAANNGYVTKWLKDHPCVKGSIYKMRVVRERSHGACVSGVSFSFNNYNDSGTVRPVLWADQGCNAVFQVCEIGNMVEGGVHDHSHDHH